jgi:hypothetical protein
MKVVRSIFLDELWAELEAIKTDKSTRRAARLDEFHKKLARLRFLDPGLWLRQCAANGLAHRFAPGAMSF